MYSFLGFTKCEDCQEIISDCNICSKDVICLECNNNAKSGYDNCKIGENKIDRKFNGEYCDSNCAQYLYKNKKDNNKINYLKDITSMS